MFVLLILLCSTYAYCNQWCDFDESMNKSAGAETIQSPRNKELFGVEGAELYSFFKKIYETNHPTKIHHSSTIRIPKIIHQIWIGKEVPKEFWAFQQSIIKFHPDWEYKLWTQYDIPDLHLHNENLIAQSRNPGEISDMMRYEILYRYGGVYLDFDTECLQSFELLNHLYDFYIGIQPLDSELVQLGIGIIGSIPGHPILKKCIENVKVDWKKMALAQMATARTGPIYCTKIFYETAEKSNHIDIALPAHYFYPLASKAQELKRNLWVEQGSFTVHHWAKSWLYPTFRRPEFQSIKNYD
jgi:mannosyltransferase OCH1-like enzyme